MRRPGILNRILLVLLPFLLGMPPLNGWGQDQRPTPKRQGFATHCFHSYKKWLDEDARWITTDEERAEYAKLATDDKRDEFIEQF